MRINNDDIKVKVKVTEIGKLKAIITLDFGEFVVKGFRVQVSQYENEQGDKLWLTPPAYADKNGKYHPIFYMPNKDQWAELEKKIWTEYYKQRNSHFEKVYEISPEKDEDDY